MYFGCDERYVERILNVDKPTLDFSARLPGLSCLG